jgi:hypothetical protein
MTERRNALSSRQIRYQPTTSTSVKLKRTKTSREA